MPLVVMIVTTAAIIGLVRYGLVPGINQLAGALSWNAKARGQATGYATSTPELVALVAAGLAGVWEVGLWNIASSNIINVVLMMSATLYYGQFGKLFNRCFLDELGFAFLGVVAPLCLMWFGRDTHWAMVPILLSIFVTYLVVDQRLNKKAEVEEEQEEDAAGGSLPMGVLFCVGTLALMAICGIYLGDATKQVVEELGMHPALAGWVLGVVTSLPEAVTFFTTYSLSRKEGKDHLLDDAQEVLDNLAASNMSNTGLVYPTGLAVYLLVGHLGG